MAQITLEQAIAKLIADKPDPSENVYHADERAIWKLEELIIDRSSTCDFSIKCTVVSTHGNGLSCISDDRLYYGDSDNLLFSVEDKFFTTESEAYEERANILANLIIGGDWKNDD